MTIFLSMIAYILGIIMGLYIKNIALIFLFLSIAFTIIIMVIKIFDLKKVISLKRLILMIIVFLISLIYILILENSFDNKYKNLEEQVKVQAIVVSDKKEKEYNNIYKIKIERINGSIEYKGTYLQLSIKNKKQTIEYGDKISFIGEYQEANGQRNYGGFDYKQHLKTNKIYGIITANKIDEIEENQYNELLILINNLRNKIIENSNKILQQEEAGLLTGILIGNKEDLEKDIQESFRDSSLSHMLAVSGAHASYIILAITILLEKLRVHKRLGKIITIILLLFFMILTGATSSVTRASIMAIYIIIGALIYKKPSILVSISVSLLIILIINPYRILDIGLQLSYGGTIGIILFGKNLEKRIKLKSNNKIIEIIKQLVIVSICANLIIFPIIAYHYNTFSLTFFISNVLAGPLLGIIIILGFILIFISFISIKIASILSIIISTFLKLLILIANFTSSLPLSKIYVTTPSILQIVCYYFALALLLYKRVNIKKIINKKLLAIILTVILIFQIIKIIPQDLKIYFVDVGQGDCCLIISPNNKAILIDGGGSKDREKYDVGKNTLIPYLLDRKITKLDYIIISHFDSDHVGGLLTVMEEIKVGQVIISKQKEDSDNYKKFKQIIKDKKIKVRVVDKGNRIQIEKDLYFYILWPNNKKLISDNSLNNNSIVCKLNYKNFSMLFTGDIEEIAERQILKEYKNSLSILNSTILKVGHHGSRTSTTKEFLEEVKPKTALIGVGKNNKFGHPNNQVIERLESVRMQDL